MSQDMTIDEQKRLALDAMLRAWEEALQQGVEAELLASTAIFAALADLIELYGEENIAQFCEGLPARVREGEFSLREPPDAE